jgi:hypothetical protein
VWARFLQMNRTPLTRVMRAQGKGLGLWWQDPGSGCGWFTETTGWKRRYFPFFRVLG